MDNEKEVKRYGVNYGGRIEPMSDGEYVYFLDHEEALKATILKLNQDGLQLANVFKARIKELENELQAERTKREETEAKLTEAHNTIGIMCDDKLALEAKVKELKQSNATYFELNSKYAYINSCLESQLATANAKIVELTNLNQALNHLQSCKSGKEYLGVLQQNFKLEQKIAELENSLNKTVCVWCGHVGKKDAKELLDHVKECSKYPMSKSIALIDALESQVERMREALKELTSAVGSINFGKNHAVKVKDDDEPVYQQRHE